MDLAGIETYESQLQAISGTIIDGVIDGNTYFSSKYRIAWFLKEAYSEDKEGFHMKEHYSQPDAYDNFFKFKATPTWHPIIYSSYGILNGFMKWSNLEYIRDEPEMCNVVKNIAMINANKAASLTGTYTTYDNLNDGYNIYKEITSLQIQTLQPHIHIFCSTFYLYQDYFGLSDANRVQLENEFENCAVFEKDGKLFLDVYHPANRSQKREIYVNQIVTAAECWAKNKLKG